MPCSNPCRATSTPHLIVFRVRLAGALVLGRSCDTKCRPDDTYVRHVINIMNRKEVVHHRLDDQDMLLYRCAQKPLNEAIQVASGADPRAETLKTRVMLALDVLDHSQQQTYDLCVVQRGPLMPAVASSGVTRSLHDLPVKICLTRKGEQRTQRYVFA